MEISIGSYKINIFVAIACVVLFWIMFGHLICSCSNVTLAEGMEAMGIAVKDKKDGKKEGKKEGMTAAAAPSKNTAPSKKIAKEGFKNASLFTPEYSDAKGSTTILPVSSWSKVYIPPSGGNVVKSGNMFDNTEFKPECCTTSSYSGAGGCACLNENQYKYLQERGGNNVPYSEY